MRPPHPSAVDRGESPHAIGLVFCPRYDHSFITELRSATGKPAPRFHAAGRGCVARGPERSLSTEACAMGHPKQPLAARISQLLAAVVQAVLVSSCCQRHHLVHIPFHARTRGSVIPFLQSRPSGLEYSGVAALRGQREGNVLLLDTREKRPCSLLFLRSLVRGMGWKRGERDGGLWCYVLGCHH